MTEPITETRAALEAERAVLQGEREQKARRQLRLNAAWADLENHATPPRAPDYSVCKSETEMRWAKLGGDVEVLRRLLGEDEAVADRALAELRADLGTDATLKADKFIHLGAPTSGDRPAQAELESLIDQHTRLGEAREAIGKKILAARDRSNREFSHN